METRRAQQRDRHRWHMQSAPQMEERWVTKVFAGCLSCPSVCAKMPSQLPSLLFFPLENRGPKDAEAYVFWHVRGESDEIKFSCRTGWRKFKYVIVLSCFVLALPFHLLLLEMTSFNQTLPLLPPPRAFSKHQPHGSASLAPLCPSIVDAIGYSSGSWVCSYINHH